MVRRNRWGYLIGAASSRPHVEDETQPGTSQVGGGEICRSSGVDSIYVVMMSTDVHTTHACATSTGCGVNGKDALTLLLT